jgi:hypothetical protein
MSVAIDTATPESEKTEFDAAFDTTDDEQTVDDDDEPLCMTTAWL